MTENEKLEMLSALTGEADDTLLSTYLTLAGQKVIRRRYPFDSSISDVPEEYAAVQIEIAAYMLQKRGAEGETAHSENGVARSYEDGDIPPTLMRQITPLAKGFSS